MAGSVAKVDKRARYNESVHNAIVKLIGDGKTQYEISEILGISPQTISLWKGKYPDLCEAIKEAREAPTDLVEIAMFQNAIGWSHEEEIAFFDKESGKIVKDKIIKKFQPSDRAGMFWLRNCRPDRWNRDIEKPDNASINMLQLIINHAISCNQDNNKIIRDVVGEEQTDSTTDSASELQDISADIPVGED
jgi:hypothetical protein